MGPAQHPRQHHFAWIHRDGDGGGAVREVPGAKDGVANAEHVGTVVEATGVQGCSGVFDQ